MITHIIVNDPWSSFADFFFPGCAGTFKDPATNKRLRSTDAKLDLAEVPFVPLRYLFKRELEKSPGSYLQLIQQLRARAINLEHELSIRVDTNLSEVVINDKTIRLSPNEFLFYLCFAKRAKDRKKPIDSLIAIETDLIRLKTSYERESDLGHWASRALQGGRFDASEDPRKWAANIRTQLRRAGLDPAQIERLVPHRGYLAIDVPAEHIEIV